MNQRTDNGPAAFAAAQDTDMADAILARSGVRIDGDRRRGRAAAINLSGRFEVLSRHDFDDGWETLEDLPPFRTEVQVEKPRNIITRNSSPDISFDRSINPYRGCEHGCIYCFARPTHSYMGLSAGLDFEARLFAKPDAPTAPGARALEARLHPAADRHRHEHRPLPAGRARMADHAGDPGSAERREPPGRHRDQVRAGDPRYRHSRLDGGTRAGEGRRLRHDARPQARARDGAARCDTAEAARDTARAVICRHTDRRHGRAGHPGTQ